MTVTKKEFVDAIAERTCLTKKESTSALDAVIDIVTQTLAEGKDVNIIGFGKFSVSERAEREGRNLQTGEKMTIAARKAPKFTPGKALKDAVNG